MVKANRKYTILDLSSICDLTDPKYLKPFNPALNERWIMLHHSQSMLGGIYPIFPHLHPKYSNHPKFHHSFLPKAMTRPPELEGNSEFLLPEERYLERKSTRYR